MTELTLRQATESDWPALVAMGLDIRHLKSEGVYACLCYEKGKLVGAATGTADVAPRLAGADETRTARLWWARSLLANREDILWALIEWQNENAIRTGHTRSEMPFIPYDQAKQCTNVVATTEVKGMVAKHPSATSITEGLNTLTQQPSHERVIINDLEAARKECRALLDKLGCKRVWA